MINEIENENAPELEIGKFSDHDPDLFCNQWKISDRMVYNMHRFATKKKFFFTKGVAKPKIRHYGKSMTPKNMNQTFF